MRHGANKTKAIIQDLAGWRLTVLMVLFINNRPMQNLELSDWIGKGDKPLAGYLDYLETHHYIQRTFHGWRLCAGVRQLDFLKELTALESETLRLELDSSALGAGVGNSPTQLQDLSPTVDKRSAGGQELGEPFNHLNEEGQNLINESEKLSDSESFLSTPPTAITNPLISNNKETEKIGQTDAEILGRMPASELLEIKQEIIRICLGKSDEHQRFFDDDRFSPQYLLGHYLQLLREDKHWNKSLLVEHWLNRPVHPDLYKQACKMIVNGDY